MTYAYAVVNIGCLECGVSSDLVGVYYTLKEAQALQEECYNKYSWREGGQNSFDIFEIKAIGETNPAYDI